MKKKIMNKKESTVGWGSIILILTVIFFLWPTYWMVIGSFKNMKVSLQIPPEWFPLHPTFENYRYLFTIHPVLRWFFNSMLVSTLSAAGVVVFGAMAAYALAKINFKSAKPVFGMMIAATTLPHTLLLIPMFRFITNLGLGNTYMSMVFPTLGGTYGVFLLKQLMQTLPGSLIDAGKIDGCSEFGIFWRIILPLSKPGLATVGIFTFVSSWNDYVWQLIVISGKSMYTLPLGIQIAQKLSEFETNYGIGMAGAVLATLPVLLIFLRFQKYFTKGITMGAVKG
jgi:multiple sugar transport system permease protein